jgi:hypothetical protein
MTHEPDIKHVDALAAIIREVDGAHSLGAAALAKEILAHPSSQWGPVLPVPTDAELKTDFVAWYENAYGKPPLGIPPSSDVIKLARHFMQRWSPQPAALWPELPDSPPLGESGSGFRPGPNDSAWFAGQLQGWRLARAELERQREQAAAVSTPAPALPEISDSLVRLLIYDVLDEEKNRHRGRVHGSPLQPGSANPRPADGDFATGRTGSSGGEVRAMTDLTDQQILQIYAECLSARNFQLSAMRHGRLWSPVARLRDSLRKIVNPLESTP